MSVCGQRHGLGQNPSIAVLQRDDRALDHPSGLRTSRSLGVGTPLERYPTTALGASEMNLVELANAYRTMTAGIVAEPYVIRAIVRDSGEVVAATRRGPLPTSIDAAALSRIQEGWRRVVSLPTGTRLVSRRGVF